MTREVKFFNEMSWLLPASDIFIKPKNIPGALLKTSTSSATVYKLLVAEMYQKEEYMHGKFLRAYLLILPNG